MKHISELKGIVSFKAVSGDQVENRDFLRQGVVGTKVFHAERYGDEILLKVTEDVFNALQIINARCFHDEKLGTVELYENGSFNVFLKQKVSSFAVRMEFLYTVTGMFTYRVENK